MNRFDNPFLEAARKSTKIELETYFIVYEPEAKSPQPRHVHNRRAVGGHDAIKYRWCFGGAVSSERGRQRRERIDLDQIEVTAVNGGVCKGAGDTTMARAGV